MKPIISFMIFIFYGTYCYTQTEKPKKWLEYLTYEQAQNMRTLLILFCLPLCMFSQKIFTVNYASQADIKVYVVDYESQADLKVYKVDYSSQADGNDGKWFFVKYSSQADTKIYFVDYSSQADLKIFFSKYSSQSGWRNNAKQHLLY